MSLNQRLADPHYRQYLAAGMDRAASAIENGGWIQGAEAVNSQGYIVSATDPDARAFCVAGGLCYAGLVSREIEDAAFVMLHVGTDMGGADSLPEDTDVPESIIEHLTDFNDNLVDEVARRDDEDYLTDPRYTELGIDRLQHEDSMYWIIGMLQEGAQWLRILDPEDDLNLYAEEA